MSIIKLTPDFFENMSLTANPVRTFSSSSIGGVTGSVFIFAERSPSEKDPHESVTPFTDFTSGTMFSDDTLEGYRLHATAVARGEVSGLGSSNILENLETYMDKVVSQSASKRKQKAVEIIRFEPSVRFTSDTLRKNVVRDVLFPHYRARYPSLHWAYSNYHSLNFFTSSQVPSDSVLVYPAISSNTQNLSSSLGGPQFAKWTISEAGWTNIGDESGGHDTFDLYDSLGQPIRVVFDQTNPPDQTGNSTAQRWWTTSASFGDLPAGPRIGVTASIGGTIPAEAVYGVGQNVYANTAEAAWYRTVLLSRGINDAYTKGWTKINADEPTTLSNIMTAYETTGSRVEGWMEYGSGLGHDGDKTATANIDSEITSPDPDLITFGEFYPNDTRLTKGTNVYLPASGAFSLECYINPRYTCGEPDTEFTAGTILHMSSTFALSLVSGSSRDVNGYTDGFRLLLQLSHSAEIAPTQIPLNLANNAYAKSTEYHNVGADHGDLIFLSSDNSLKRNHWHHVSVRWGADVINDGSGSFVVDGVEDSIFVISSASAFTDDFGFTAGGTQADADALFVGNFFDGSNNTSNGSLISEFFNSQAARVQGTSDAFNGAYPTEGESVTLANGLATDYEPDPSTYRLDNPLNAEIHDIKIFDTYRAISQIVSSSQRGSNVIESGQLFYLPPFFVKETRQREVLQTPFQSYKTTTDDPFNVALSFGVDGHLLNLENFCREFVRGEYPRLLSLTASSLGLQTDTAETCNNFLFKSGSVRKRNLTVLPCDNGKFFPGFSLLESGTVSSRPASGSNLEKHTNDFGSLDLGLISLTDLVTTSSLMPGLFQYAVRDDSDRNAAVSSGSILGRGFVNPENLYPDAVGTGSIAAGIMGGTPENPGVVSGSILTIFQRTRDNSSNAVVFFDISNMFYGNKIKPETFKLTDSNVTGSGGAVSITVRDNGNGNLYRADSATVHAKWSSVGNILYEEGI
ncbi:MAG: hypothetical protein CMB80_14995, partial [Flammeovirgaceae bacterium]|nr:hypothetical protein [Flammeovirgaceae bacterium]